METASPELMKLKRVPWYIRTTYGTEVTRQTIYNWVKTGVKGIKLKTVAVVNLHCYIRTAKEWVDQFFRDLQAVR